MATSFNIIINRDIEDRDFKCGFGYSREGIEERIIWGLFGVDGADVANGYQRNMSPKIVGSRFPSGEFKVQLTQYQKRYFARLYRVGLMKKRGLAKVPMEKRVGVKKMIELEKEVRETLSKKNNGPILKN